LQARLRVVVVPEFFAAFDPPVQLLDRDSIRLLVMGTLLAVFA
jgi:hypothetical protein